MDSFANNDFVIRKATPNDMPEVRKLIQELVDFEKTGKEVKIDANDLKRDGFELDQPLFHCIVAEKNSQIVGYVIFFHTYSTIIGKALYLEDIYVKSQHRGKKIGKHLFLAVAKFAHETCSRLTFHALSWNPAMDFYKKFGAVNLTETDTCQLMSLNRDAINKLFL